MITQITCHQQDKHHARHDYLSSAWVFLSCFREKFKRHARLPGYQVKGLMASSPYSSLTFPNSFLLRKYVIKVQWLALLEVCKSSKRQPHSPKISWSHFLILSKYLAKIGSWKEKEKLQFTQEESPRVLMRINLSSAVSYRNTEVIIAWWKSITFPRKEYSNRMVC
jgi:hypothetical protein